MRARKGVHVRVCASVGETETGGVCALSVCGHEL